MNRKTKVDEMLGYDNQIFEPPVWETESLLSMKGYCIWCGSPLPKRCRRYCPDSSSRYSECKIKTITSGWSSYKPTNSVRRHIHERDLFKCQFCNGHLSRITPAGVELAVFKGHVHHIVPLYAGGKDELENMILLCKPCHRKIHDKPEATP